MITLRQLSTTELGHVREIDVTEAGDMLYRWEEGQLKENAFQWQRPHWTEQRCQEVMADWEATLAAGGTVIGAFAGDLMVGHTVLRPQLTETMAQLKYLHVSREYRRQGVARMLTLELIRLARQSGAQQLYVSATPSRSAVGFYTSVGFRPTNEPHPELLAEEPEDIHMTMTL